MDSAPTTTQGSSREPNDSSDSAGTTTIRKRKIHKKSRLGCRNCKLRRIKCDERKPMCRKCLDFGVLCNYDASTADLQPFSGAESLAAARLVQSSSVDNSASLTRSAMVEMIDVSLQRDGKDLSFSPLDLDRLYRFQHRTGRAIGTRRTSLILRSEMTKLACTHRFVMHFVQAITAMHDRFMNPTATTAERSLEAQHMNQGIAIFSEKLAKPIISEERDALWAAACLIGIAAFCSIDAETPYQAWPLKSSDSGRLDWLNLTDGKKSVWRVASPMRNGSVWMELNHAYETDAQDIINARTTLPSTTALGSVFGHLVLEDSPAPLASNRDLSQPSPNPYRKAVDALVPLLEIECNDMTALKFVGFVCCFDPAFRGLLENKDPWALMIMAYWYAKTCRSRWWVARRAVLEGVAICLYIEMHHSNDSVLMAALDYPRREFASLKHSDSELVAIRTTADNGLADTVTVSPYDCTIVTEKAEMGDLFEATFPISVAEPV